MFHWRTKFIITFMEQNNSRITNTLLVEINRRMLYARNSSFLAFSPARQFSRSAYSWAASLKSGSLAIYTSQGADKYFSVLVAENFLFDGECYHHVISRHQEISVSSCMLGRYTYVHGTAYETNDCCTCYYFTITCGYHRVTPTLRAKHTRP